MSTVDTADGRAAKLDRLFVLRWIQECAASLEAEREYLTQLDAAIGDADHGVNMDRGMRAARAKVRSMDAEPAGSLLEAVGATLILTVGGAAGPLYGTAFQQAGRSLHGCSTFDALDLLSALSAGLQGVQRLGAASEGDKTIVDAFAPALSAFRRGLMGGGSLASATTRAREAAEVGMRATTPLQARKGRASYLGPRSIGHQDPGATSTALLFAALERAAGELDS